MSDLFAAQVEALVNPVNCVGVMGAGLAREVKWRFPWVFREYERACRERQIHLGKVQVVSVVPVNGSSVRYVINFPTKDHWRDGSELLWIEMGLWSLGWALAEHHIHSVAIPALGCGLGGLKWSAVEPLITQAAQGWTGVDVWVFPPLGT